MMVYILEDDCSILELVLYALNSQGIIAKGFADPQECLESLNQEVPKVLILDIMLPKISGLDFLMQIKNHPRTKYVSVLLLSALGEEVDKVKGLELGADDYLVKPFGMMELIARVKAALRRTRDVHGDEISCDDLVLSFKKRLVRYRGSEVNLTFKEFELLGFFLKNQGHAFSRDELLEIVWGYSYGGESRTVDIHIKTLRQKLGEFGRHIKTIRNIGYKFSKED